MCENKKHILHRGVSIGLALFANSMEKDVYAPSFRESGLHRSCNRTARTDVELDCLDCMDMSGKPAAGVCRAEGLLVDVVEAFIADPAEPYVLFGSFMLHAAR